MIELRFEWDEAKANANLRAHGVSFGLATTVFDDVFAVDRRDTRTDYGEQRFVLTGKSKDGFVLVVVYTNVKTASALSRREGQRDLKNKNISSRTREPHRRMTSEEIERAALADPDAQPLTEDDLKRMPRVPQVKVIRRALRLTQEEFAGRYHIPLGTLRDWEQGRTAPDQPAQAYLTLIARDPVHVYTILQRPLVQR